jgi:MoaA/NifB/PqqE/SkfB family radical SAM enzyme
MRSAPISRYLKAGYYAVRNNVAREHLYPLFASFKLHRACPLACSYCKYWREKPPSVLDTNGVKAVLDNLARSSVMVVSLEGGEPLFRRDLMDILKHARKLPFILQLTTAGINLERYPIAEYVKYLDFLHISIDEGHENLYLLDRLDTFRSFGIGLAIQIVVTVETLPFLEEKIRRIADAGARAVLMPAAQEEGLDCQLPDPIEFGSTVRSLKAAYPGCIVTPDGFLEKIGLEHGCSAASIIIDCDGRLYYPCSVMDQKTIDLTRDSLMEFVVSTDAQELRARMHQCRRRCCWYQYFAVGTYIEPKYVHSSVTPYLKWIWNGAR